MSRSLVQERRVLNPTAVVSYHNHEDVPDEGIGAFKLTVRNEAPTAIVSTWQP